MKKESLSASMPKLIMIVSLIVGIGAMMGVMGYFGTMPKSEVLINDNGKKEVLDSNIELVEYNSADKSLFEWENYNIKYPNNWTYTEERVASARKTGAMRTVFDGKNTRNEVLSIVAGGDRPANLLNMNMLEVEISNKLFEKYNSNQNEAEQMYYIYKTGTDEEISLGMEAEIIFEFNNIDERIINEILGTFNSQLIDETVNWKTYRNEEYGFEFKYPSTLVLEEKNDEQAGWKAISVFMKSGDFNGYILVNSAGVGTGFSVDVVKEEITVGGINTNLEVLDSSVDNQRAAMLKFNKNNNEYFWLFKFNKEDSDKIDMSKKIFSTFKFIEK